MLIIHKKPPWYFNSKINLNFVNRNSTEIKVTIVFSIGKCQRRIQERWGIQDGPHCSTNYNSWKPATLQQFQEGSSYFAEHVSMAVSERIKFFTQSNGGKNKVIISKTFISSCSHLCWMWKECEANWSKQIFNNYTFKELIEVSFFAIQANFHFNGTNFTEAKFYNDSLN